MTASASAWPKKPGVVSLVTRSFSVSGLGLTPVSLSGSRPSSAIVRQAEEGGGGTCVSTTISSERLRSPKPLACGVGRIDHLHAGREEVAAVGQRERRGDSANDAIAFEIELVHAFGDLPGVSDRNLRQLAGLLRRAFVEDGDAEAGVDAGNAVRFALRRGVAAEGNRDRALVRIELIAGGRIARHVLQVDARRPPGSG